MDTVRIILTNKISAILGRDEARDVADLICISRKRAFSWDDALSESARKEAFELSDLLSRIQIISDIERRGENTLAERDALPL